MDKDAGEDVGRGKARKVVLVYVSRRLRGYKKKIVDTEKNPKD